MVGDGIDEERGNNPWHVLSRRGMNGTIQERGRYYNCSSPEAGVISFGDVLMIEGGKQGRIGGGETIRLSIEGYDFPRDNSHLAD